MASTRSRLIPAAAAVAAALAAGTFVHLGHDADAALWAAVQVVLVALAAIDIATRRLPNAITLPVSAAAVVLRAAAERDALAEIAVAGAVSFVAFLAIALIARGGFGMGDVKLAAMLGFLLGAKALTAFAVGILAGGAWAAVLLVTRRAGLRTAFAYGPFLCLGGAVAILFSGPPSLV